MEVAEGVLTVKSIKDVTDGDDSKIYSGIANRQFTRKFTISDDIVVKDGELKDGMLRITLERVITHYKFVFASCFRDITIIPTLYSCNIFSVFDDKELCFLK